LRVLVVDDDADARAVLKRVLTRGGAEVTDASDVPGALGALGSFRPDVLISDVGIPHQDGYDLIRLVRERGYAAAALPAIALTAFAREEDRKRSSHAGFQMHLSKPVDAVELVAAVRRVARPGRTG
jgi:CheY-like chemotaxis protein